MRGALTGGSIKLPPEPGAGRTSSPGFTYSAEARARFDAINRSDCGAGRNIPAQQRLNASRNAMSGEGWQQVSVERDNRFGIVVLNAWIRGDDRQRVTNYMVLGPAVGRFETDPDSDRGTTYNFQPNDSRATIVLDYASGVGYTTVHSTTYRINLIALPDPTLTRSAYTPSFDFGQFQVADPDPTWWWEDKPTSSRHRLRLHLTARPPFATGVDFFEIHEDVFTPSVDQQIYFNRNNGSTAGPVYYQGESFPNISVYRYAGCTSWAQRKLLSEHVDSAWAWLNMIDRTSWSYNNTYGRGI